MTFKPCCFFELCLTWPSADILFDPAKKKGAGVTFRATKCRLNMRGRHTLPAIDRAAHCYQTLTFTGAEPDGVAAEGDGDALMLSCFPEQATLTGSEEAWEKKTKEKCKKKKKS